MRGPQPVPASELYAFAQMFYWDLRRIAEGHRRWLPDKHDYEQRLAKLERRVLRFSERDKNRLKGEVAEEIRKGLLSKDKVADRLQDMEDAELRARHHVLRIAVSDKTTKQIRVPGEPDVIRDLLQASTPERVRQICEDAFTTMPVEVEPGVFELARTKNWPISSGSTLPRCLSEYAEQFIAAKNDPRYPRSDRPTNRLKQLWFLSRALAGALFNVATRTAINLVGSQRPEEIFEASNGAKPARRMRSKGDR